MPQSSQRRHGRVSPIAERRARAEAARVVSGLGLELPEHIRIEDIAWSKGLRITEGGLTGAAARVASFNGRGVIRVRAGDLDSPRGRFSIAHELGHFLLHQARMRACSDTDMTALHTDGRDEAQANVFAAELLVPEAMCRPLCDVIEPDLSTARLIADTFNVSLTAAAFRLVELVAVPCALLFVEASRIRWFRAGGAFRARLNTLGPPHRLSLVARALRERRSQGPEAVDAECWLEDDESALELVEDVVVMPSLGGALVLLQAPDRDEDEE